MLELSDLLRICLFLFKPQDIGEQGGVVKNDSVGDKTTTLQPQVLFSFGFEAESTKVSVGNSPSELMVIFTTIKSRLDMTPQRERINIVEQIKTPENVIVFPKGLLSFIAAGVRTELTDK